MRVVSGSIGIAVCPDDATDVDQIISHADHAMYRCKRKPQIRQCLTLRAPVTDRSIHSGVLPFMRQPHGKNSCLCPAPMSPSWCLYDFG